MKTLNRFWILFQPVNLIRFSLDRCWYLVVLLHFSDESIYGKMIFVLVVIGWIIHLTVGFYLIRPVHYGLLRFLLAVLPCILLTYFGTHNISRLDVTSTVIVTFSWLFSIRFTDLVVFSPNKVSTLNSFLLKFLFVLISINRISMANHWRFYLSFRENDIQSFDPWMDFGMWIKRWIC